ncbi:conserved exported hypothetical protein [Gammaproteobacteria bacterium]
MQNKTLNRGSLFILLMFLNSTFPASAEKLIVFRPAQLGAPTQRIGGGTRSFQKVPKIQLLAPPQTGLTKRAAPTLYWYSSTLSLYNVEFSLELEDENQTVLDVKLGTVNSPGIQVIRLSELGVKLKPDQIYRWTVVLSSDKEPDANLLFSNATISRKTPTLPLNNVADLAEAGYWYDALEKLIEKNKSEQVDDLLAQVGIALQ